MSLVANEMYDINQYLQGRDRGSEIWILTPPATPGLFVQVYV